MHKKQFNIYPSLPEAINEESLENIIYKNDQELTCCLRQINLSHSSIFLDPYYPFPEITDLDLSHEPKLSELEHQPKIEFDDFGLWKYLQYCQNNATAPLPYVVDIFKEANTICNLTSYTNNITPIFEALYINTTITEIRLDNIDLSNIVFDQLIMLINECNQISKLSLKNCLKNCLIFPINLFRYAKSLTDLNLSHNNLGNNIPVLQTLIEDLINNQTIQKINLSQNSLKESSCYLLANYLQKNSVLECIDLSWNLINTTIGHLILYNKLANYNETLKELILRCNGIKFVEAIRPLAKFIRESFTLETLDLSHNLINDSSVPVLRNSFMKTSVLSSINLSFNQFDEKSTEKLLRILLDAPDKNMYLNIDNCYVNVSFEPILKKIEQNPLKKFVIGGILGKFVLQKPDFKSILIMRINYLTKSKRSKKKKNRNFGQFLYDIIQKKQFIVESSLNIDKDNFLTVLKKSHIKFDKDLIDGIFANWAFTVNGPNQLLDLQNLLEDYLRIYPETELINRVTAKTKKLTSKKSKRKKK